jgi:hypothetical protein
LWSRTKKELAQGQPLLLQRSKSKIENVAEIWMGELLDAAETRVVRSEMEITAGE